MPRRFRLFLLASTSLAPICAPTAFANPLGGQVVGGSANIAGQGGANVTITQTTPMDSRGFPTRLRRSTRRPTYRSASCT